MPGSESNQGAAEPGLQPEYQRYERPEPAAAGDGLIPRLPEDLFYERRVTAFLDVLGWTAAVQRSTADRGSLRALVGALDLLAVRLEGMRAVVSSEGATSADVRMTRFSDSAVVSFLADRGKDSATALKALLSAVADMSRELLMCGLTVRGGVTIGPLYHSSNAVLGPALNLAYDLETHHAIYPRVVLGSMKTGGPALLDVLRQGAVTWGRPGPRELLDLDSDAYLFVNFLRPPDGANPDNRRAFFQHFDRPMRAVFAQVEEPRHHLKADWLQRYRLRMEQNYLDGVGGSE